jgi:RNA polymerase sigma-70 factor, ECF subfamily
MNAEGIMEAWRSASEAWPGVLVDKEEFAAYLEERSTSGVEGDRADARPLVTRDLYLACACARGDARALYVFEEHFFPQVDAAARRVGGTVSSDEVRQAFRHKLFVADPGQKPKIAEYSGHGQLRTWVRMAATRMALNMATRTARELPFEQDALAYIIGGGDDPELRFIKQRYADEFRLAFGDAFSALGSRERNLLRYAFGRGLTVDQIGPLYGVHRATAARWIANAHLNLVSQLRKTMLARLHVSKGEYSSILRLIESQVEISFDRYLGTKDEG